MIHTQEPKETKLPAPRFAGMLNAGDWKVVGDALGGPMAETVARVLEAYGFERPRSSSSVLHNIVAHGDEKEAHETRLAALRGLVAEAKKAARTLNGKTMLNTELEDRNRLLHAILAVEREFKL